MTFIPHLSEEGGGEGNDSDFLTVTDNDNRDID